MCLCAYVYMRACVCVCVCLRGCLWGQNSPRHDTQSRFHPPVRSSSHSAQKDDANVKSYSEGHEVHRALLFNALRTQIPYRMSLQQGLLLQLWVIKCIVLRKFALIAAGPVDLLCESKGQKTIPFPHPVLLEESMVYGSLDLQKI